MSKIAIYFIFFLGLGIQSHAQVVPAAPAPPPVAPAQPQAAPASQNDKKLPCQKNPTIPALDISLVDTSKVFNTKDIKEGKKTAFVVFGPDCSHCRDFFRQLFIGIDTLTNIDFYLVTPIRDYYAFRRFYYDMNIESHKNIKVAGRDLNFFAMDFFGVSQFPTVIIYDEHKKIIGSFGAGNALSELHN